MEWKQNVKAKSQCSQELGLLMCETLRWRNLNKASLWSWWVKKKGKALHHPCAWIESCWPSRRGSLSWGTFWWIQPRPLRFWLTIKICNILWTWSVCPLSCLSGHFFFSHLFALYYRLDKQNGRANILLHQAALAGTDEADLPPCNFFLSMEFCCGYTHECFFSVCWWTSDCSFGQGNDSQNLQGKDSCLHSDEQLYIPISTLCIQVLQCIHDALIAGHGSHQKPAWSHEEILVAHSSCWCCELFSVLAISSPGSSHIITWVKRLDKGQEKLQGLLRPLPNLEVMANYFNFCCGLAYVQGAHINVCGIGLIYEGSYFSSTKEAGYIPSDCAFVFAVCVSLP